MFAFGAQSKPLTFLLTFSVGQLGLGRRHAVATDEDARSWVRRVGQPQLLPEAAVELFESIMHSSAEHAACIENVDQLDLPRPNLRKAEQAHPGELTLVYVAQRRCEPSSKLTSAA